MFAEEKQITFTTCSFSMKSTSENIEACKSFNFYVNLFDNGEYNEVIITKDSEGYRISLDQDTYLGTLAQSGDQSWELIKGSLPSYIMQEITRGIDRQMKN